MRLISLIIVILFITGGNAYSQDEPLPVETVKEVARAALPVLGQLVTAENFEAMGFRSLEDAAKVTLDDTEPPLQVFMVRLDRLKEYQAGADANSLLTGGDMVYYPVTVGGEVTAAVGIAKTKEQWEVTSLGDANLIRMLTSARKRSMDASELDAKSYFIVWVAALNLHFVAYRADERLMLVPVQDEPTYKFETGVAMPAEQAFEAILPAAKAHDGSPG
ncbi:MAG: hypothetical protein JSW34_12915 [Candidatus Zixiibacteriota bacterium]|nr:MAG: hypothetical protein JSW34_12915 [candidate division Zixibacteria bacterium]